MALHWNRHGNDPPYKTGISSLHWPFTLRDRMVQIRGFQQHPEQVRGVQRAKGSPKVPPRGRPTAKDKDLVARSIATDSARAPASTRAASLHIFAVSASRRGTMRSTAKKAAQIPRAPTDSNGIRAWRKYHKIQSMQAIQTRPAAFFLYFRESAGSCPSKRVPQFKSR